MSKRVYVCAICKEPVTYNAATGGLGTWRCRAHPYRTVTVKKDLSAGKEKDSRMREEPWTVGRHTQVEVRFG